MSYLNIIKQTLEIEKNAIQVLIDDCCEAYEEVCKVLSQCKGKVIFMGVGKTGHIGKKLAATFASTGTPSFFVHGTEALHGDFGMVDQNDVVILISNSGNTNEIINDLLALKNIGCKTIAFTANASSYIAQNCDYQLIYPKVDEADHLNLAPTTSSTLALALGDAIACALSTNKAFTKEDFHKYHPGGSLGKMLKGE
ncbi:MAG TPA: SIS domain-containing protein [Patescibacteria group bacterium]|jgi:KpsF/GutQ family protein|nr:SIS domain-containing protein [Patescibacteria group bacterium]